MKTYNSDNFKARKFAPHGTIKLESFDNGIKFYRAIGPFNLELFNAYKSLEHSNLKEKQPYCKVVVFENSCLIHCDVLYELQGYIEEKEVLGMLPLATAFVIPDDLEGAILMNEAFSKIYEKSSQEFFCFETKEAAIKWVETCLNNLKMS